MIYSGAGPLLRHTYCYVEPDTFGNNQWEKVAWFGLVSHPDRTWGCHVLLECGAGPLKILNLKRTNISLKQNNTEN